MSAMQSPPRLTSIVAVDQTGAIGCRNTLPWKLPTDMAFFRSTTLNHSVIMGRKTFDSIGSPLAGRKNIVLSHNWQLFNSTPDCNLALSVPESVAQAHLNRSREAYVIGGAATYLEFAQIVDRYLVTIVDHETPDADAFLDASILAEMNGWERRELTNVVYTKGKDQFGFKVFEFEAPDADERATMRQEMAAKVMIRKHKAAASSSRNQLPPQAKLQAAFGF
jgi:dihydrofolate reductase